MVAVVFRPGLLGFYGFPIVHGRSGRFPFRALIPVCRWVGVQPLGFRRLGLFPPPSVSRFWFFCFGCSRRLAPLSLSCGLAGLFSGRCGYFRASCCLCGIGLTWQAASVCFSWPVFSLPKPVAVGKVRGKCGKAGFSLLLWFGQSALFLSPTSQSRRPAAPWRV